MSRVVALVVVALLAFASADTCREYCDVAATACTGATGTANAYPFVSDAGCMAVCDTWPTDDILFAGNTTGNSLQCRFYHVVAANASSGAAVAHCKHASAGGGLAGGAVGCGSTCESYCNTYTDATVISRLGGAVFSGWTQCMTYCNNMRSDGVGMTLPPATSGSTKECRSYHGAVGVQVSGTAGVDHLMHGLPGSTSQCIPSTASGNYSGAVEVYCDTVIAGCALSGADPTYGQYASLSQCLIEGSYFTRGAINDQSGNTLDCRLYHAGVASQAATKDAHCEHSGLNGKNVCGTSACVSYCTVVMGACTAAAGNAQFTSTAACLAWCASYPTTGSERPYATSGSNLQCRIYHAGVAGQRSDLATAHCAHAGPSGGGVCGSLCEGFCYGQITACGTSGTTSQWASQSACETSCATWTVGTISTTTTSGNTLGCRLYHANVAALDSGSATTHCPHTGPTPTSQCVDTMTSSTSTMMVSSTASMMTSSTGGSMSAASALQASIALIAVLATAVVASL